MGPSPRILLAGYEDVVVDLMAVLLRDRGGWDPVVRHGREALLRWVEDPGSPRVDAVVVATALFDRSVYETLDRWRRPQGIGLVIVTVRPSLARALPEADRVFGKPVPVDEFVEALESFRPWRPALPPPLAPRERRVLRFRGILLSFRAGVVP